MKKFIAKTLSILLVIAMLVPMMGIMTSAEEGLVNIFKEPAFSETSQFVLQTYSCEEDNLKPGDVITIAPISKSSSTLTILERCYKSGTAIFYQSYNLKDLYVEDISFGTAIVQFTIPDNTEYLNFRVIKALCEYTLMTVNQPFGAKEYLDYMKDKDLSFFMPDKYTGEFENVFSISDAIVGKTISNGNETNSTNYVASGYIPVSAGDVVYFASPAARTVYYYDSDMNYMTSVTSVYQVKIVNDAALGYLVNAFIVPNNVKYIRFSVSVANSIATAVTINQPITSFNEYKFLTAHILTVKGDCTYTGNAIVPDVEVMRGGKALKADVDYYLYLSNNVDAGNANVTVELIGNDSAGLKVVLSSVSQKFAIAPKSVSDVPVDIKLSRLSYPYNGNAKYPSVKEVKVAGKKVTNYTVTYTDNINAGTATVTLTFRGNYSGTATKTFTISPKKVNLESSTLVLTRTEYEYTGSPIIPEFSFDPGIKGLEEGKDYIITYENNVNAGTATITATLIGNYSGSISKTFTIAPREVILVWENTDMMYNGERQVPTAKLFGVAPGDVCEVNISGWGKFGGTYTAKVESLSNPNYYITGDTTCRFNIIANPFEAAVDVAVDIYNIIPDSTKQAVADAAIDAALNAFNNFAGTAIEAAEAKAAEIKETVETAYEQTRDFLTDIFGSYTFFGW